MQGYLKGILLIAFSEEDLLPDELPKQNFIKNGLRSNYYKSSVNIDSKSTRFVLDHRLPSLFTPSHFSVKRLDPIFAVPNRLVLYLHSTPDYSNPLTRTSPISTIDYPMIFIGLVKKRRIHRRNLRIVRRRRHRFLTEISLGIFRFHLQ